MDSNKKSFANSDFPQVLTPTKRPHELFVVPGSLLLVGPSCALQTPGCSRTCEKEAVEKVEWLQTHIAQWFINTFCRSLRLNVHNVQKWPSDSEWPQTCVFLQGGFLAMLDLYFELPSADLRVQIKMEDSQSDTCQTGPLGHCAVAPFRLGSDKEPKGAGAQGRQEMQLYGSIVSFHLVILSIAFCRLSESFFFFFSFGDNCKQQTDCCMLLNLWWRSLKMMNQNGSWRSSRLPLNSFWILKPLQSRSLEACGKLWKHSQRPAHFVSHASGRLPSPRRLRTHTSASVNYPDDVPQCQGWLEHPNSLFQSLFNVEAGQCWMLKCESAEAGWSLLQLMAAVWWGISWWLCCSNCGILARTPGPVDSYDIIRLGHPGYIRLHLDISCNQL